MKNKRDKYKIILWSIFFVIIIPVILNLLYKFDSGICIFQTEWQAEDTLSFYGDILGAAVTVIGVVWTINNERKERKKDNSILYKPILELVQVNPQTLTMACGYREVGLGYQIGFRNDQTEIEKLTEIFFEQQRQNNPKDVLLFQNVGRGETFNAVVDKFVVKDKNWSDISYIDSNVNCNQYIGEIIQNGFFYIRVNLPDYLILPKSLENQKWFEFGTELSVSYSDMFNRIRYRTILHMRYKIFVEEEVQPTPSIARDDYHYVKVRYDLYQIMPQKKIFSPIKNAFVNENKIVLDDEEAIENPL
ncbi:MAG: hypothetical protein Q4B89_07880 [Lachnospiraceae bacterium]|nr:hypothetical protein [Lachnospiraceae bacterium]